MEINSIILLLSSFAVFVAASPEVDPIAELARNLLIASINARAKTWTAGVNPGPEPAYMAFPGKASPAELSLFDLDPLMSRNGTVQLPDSFDARLHWPNCPSLRQIRDQACCASCYAVSVAAAITDRWCIHSNGTQQHTFSSQDAASCCGGCGNCTGGYHHRVWVHWRLYGLVSGGELNSEQGCRPYEVPACSVGQPEELECVEECSTDHAVAYNDDKRYAARVYRVAQDEQMIMQHIFLGGPVTAMFEIFSDFGSYRTGVYQHVSGRSRGWHTVKLLGWGVEKGTKYWLVANTWGSAWGRDGGFFKILRGENHVGIEGAVYAGLPRYE